MSRKKKKEEKREQLAIKDFFDRVLPGVLKFYSDHYICGDSYRCVWAVKEYPPSTEEQAILRQLADRTHVTLRIYNRLVDHAEQHRIIQNANRRNRLRFGGDDIQEKASQVAASYLGGESLYLGTYYKTYAATDSQGRMWKFTYDGSIQAEKKENGERVPADKPYKTEMVSPICTYEDIPTIQELVRQLRHKGAFSNSSTGIHIHVDASSFDARTLRNLVNLFYSKEDLLFAALKVDPARWAYCSPTDERFIQELNRKRPQTMKAFQKIWYGGEDGSDLHYHQSRYHALNLHSVFSKDTVEVRLFNSTVEHAGKIKADIQLCLAMCAQALNQRAASHTKTQTTNPAYTFRTWLLRLGMIGDEFATARKHLLENLEGNLAWRDPAQAERQRERMRQAALERLPQPDSYPHDEHDQFEDQPSDEPENVQENDQDEDQGFTMQM